MAVSFCFLLTSYTALTCGLLGGTPPQEGQGGLQLLRPQEERHPEVGGERGAAHRDEDEETLREVRSHPEESCSGPGHGVHDRPGHEDLEKRAKEASTVYPPYLPAHRREAQDGEHGVSYREREYHAGHVPDAGEPVGEGRVE